MAEKKKTPVAGAKNPFAKEKLPDARITWIQSYPRSGNAWVRAFLYTYMAEKDTIDLQAMGRAFSHDSSAFIFERLMREEVSKLKPADIGEKRTEFLLRACRSSQNDLVMRSHLLQTDWGGQPTFLPHFSRAAIVVVRDPRDIAISTAADMEIPVDAAIANMAQPQFALLSKGTTPQPIGSWTRNVLSWLSRPSMPRLFVRYEDLIENPRKEFMRIIAFMNLRLDFGQLDKALEA
ncbi:MAG: sulfotransferase domain-containing protein, partial [Pseudomonadota bacterium]|nr:sulfotransferase domain-containing protein [Pseudomonadota bacterium]